MHTNKPDSAADPMGLKPAGTAQAGRASSFEGPEETTGQFGVPTEAGFTAVLLGKVAPTT